MKRHILISGSRGWKDKRIIEKILKIYCKNTIFIHGGAYSGVDKFVSELCYENGWESQIYRPITHAKASYLYRNAEMVGKCDNGLIFWDGISTGTAFTMNYLKKRNKLLQLIKQEVRE